MGKVLFVTERDDFSLLREYIEAVKEAGYSVSMVGWEDLASELAENGNAVLIARPRVWSRRKEGDSFTLDKLARRDLLPNKVIYWKTQYDASPEEANVHNFKAWDKPEELVKLLGRI